MERVAIGGDWHRNTAWAVRAIHQLPADVRVLIHLGDFGLMNPGQVVAAIHVRLLPRDCRFAVAGFDARS